MRQSRTGDHGWLGRGEAISLELGTTMSDSWNFRRYNVSTMTYRAPIPAHPPHEIAVSALSSFADGACDDATVEQAMAQLYRLCGKYLLFFGARGDELDNFAQEAVCRVYIHRQRFCGLGLGRFKAAVRTTCWRIFLDGRRAAAVRPSREDAKPARVSVDGALEACIDGLPENDRVLFELRFRLDLSPGEMARVTGKSVRWVQLRIQAIREQLAARLRREGYDVQA